MTPEEFELEAKKALEERPMRDWERHDARSLVYYAKKRGEVTKLDILLLSYLGVPQTGPPNRMPTGPKKEWRKQAKLF